MRRCVWSRNIKSEEVMARVGPQRYGGGGGEKKIFFAPQGAGGV